MGGFGGDDVHRCDLCKAFVADNRVALANHKRGCMRKHGGGVSSSSGGGGGSSNRGSISGAGGSRGGGDGGSGVKKSMDSKKSGSNDGADSSLHSQVTHPLDLLS